jgi:hypothetical protein
MWRWIRPWGMFRFVAAVQCPARIPETLDQFSTDLISLDRFGSKAEMGPRPVDVRFVPKADIRRYSIISSAVASS